MRPTTSAHVTPGTFAELNALQREANALNSPLAAHEFYRRRFEQSEGGLRNLIAQVLAANEAELGDYERAVLRFPLGAPGLRGAPAALPDRDTHRAVNAADGIAALARERRIVVVNEAHHAAQTRVLTLQLLPKLRDLGYTHLAVEGLDERDREIATRGYPVQASGTYLREPLYAEIVRRALRLGYVVVPYESARPQADADTREEDQAQHIVERVFRAAPDARLLVHAGYAHAHERTGYLDAEPMALRLKRKTGFDPLTIDQTLLRPIEPAREYRDYRELLRRFAIAAPGILVAKRDGAAWSLEPGYYDVSVVLPPPAKLIVGRPDWLTLGGTRAPVAIDVDLSAAHLPCLIEARHAGENDKAVPADRELVERDATQAVLFLAPGDYRLSAVDASGSVFLRRSLRVD
ncbi:MAG: hypothetical protein JSS42_10975 [Proteobacteria bacterium]|nr:hypothetical protein [Pseudomonadota bacterium]